MPHRPQTYFRNFIFGVEDSLVSTVGMLSGIATAGMARADIVTAGVVLIFVEAFSMAVGSFLSERSAEEFANASSSSSRLAPVASIIMFISYFISGFIPLGPYFFLSGRTAVIISMGASLVALCILGVVGARISRVNAIRGGLRMFLLGGLAIALGVAVGSFFV